MFETQWRDERRLGGSMRMETDLPDDFPKIRPERQEKYINARRPRRFRYRLLLLAVIPLAVVLPMGSGLYTDLLWFQQLGYQTVFTTTLGAKALLGAAVGLITAALIWLNFNLALRLSPQTAGRARRFVIEGQEIPAPDFSALAPRLAPFVALAVGAGRRLGRADVDRDRKPDRSGADLPDTRRDRSRPVAIRIQHRPRRALSFALPVRRAVSDPGVRSLSGETEPALRRERPGVGRELRRHPRRDADHLRADLHRHNRRGAGSAERLLQNEPADLGGNRTLPVDDRGRLGLPVQRAAFLSRAERAGQRETLHRIQHRRDAQGFCP